MVAPSSIGWGSYSAYEGPFYKGWCKYQLPNSPTEGDRILNTITATEGGAYDAYNGYDKCICTSGLIQWCDRAPFFLVCKMLGAVADRDVALLAPVLEHISPRGYTFGRTADGRWLFWHTSDGDLVNTQDKQRTLYLGGSSGLRGAWMSSGQKQVAKEWAAACSSVWEYPEAQKVQREYTSPRVMNFATKYAQGVLDAAVKNGEDLGLVFRAAYLSFAANNPTWATNSLRTVLLARGVSWDRDWLIAVLKALTFNPGISIYPHRYNKIRPVLEQMYGIDLPDFADELKGWKEENDFKGALPTRALQKALLQLGYDLGPAGADDVFGDKTRSALYRFEKDFGVPISHQDGYPDSYTVPHLERELEKKGFTLEWENA